MNQGKGPESAHALSTFRALTGYVMLLESDLELHTVDSVISKIKSLTIGSAGFQLTVIIPHKLRTNPEPLGQIDGNGEPPKAGLDRVVSEIVIYGGLLLAVHHMGRLQDQPCTTHQPRKNRY